MSKKNKNLEILENIKKNDPRFKDLIISKNKIIMPTEEEFFSNIPSLDKKTKDVVYANETHNNSL